MKSYYFLFDSLAYMNSALLLFYAIMSIQLLKKNKNNVLKIIAFYLLFSCFFDLTSQVVSKFLIPEVFSSTIFLSILYRLGELVIIGFLINKVWLKSNLIWMLIGTSALYLIYDLFTYRDNGILNYVAYAQITANVLLIFIVVFNLLKQLQSSKSFSVTNQMLSMVFLAYFAIHLIYTVISNFIINQNYSNQSFVLFYCSYAILHIIYYFALAFIVYKKSKKLLIKN